MALHLGDSEKLQVNIGGVAYVLCMPKSMPPALPIATLVDGVLYIQDAEAKFEDGVLELM